MKNFLVVIFIAAITFCFTNELVAQEMGPEAQASVAAVPQQSDLIQQLAAQAQQMQQQHVQVNRAPTTAVGNSQAAAANSGGKSVAVGNGSGSVNAQQGIAPQQPGSMYDDAFSGVVNQMLPMTPEQISRLRSLFNASQKAAATPPGVPAKPVTSSVLVDLSPQASPPVIRLGAGYISSLVFMDSTGQPWPIQSYSIGDPSAFNIQWDKKSNTLLIQASSFYKRSNLAVILKGLDTPVMLSLLSGQEAIDYRVDLRVPGLGPNAVFVQDGLPDSANPVLLDVLNGVPPSGSKTLKVIGGDCQAWLLNNHLFLRTSLEVISPAWRSVMNSADGTHAYELQPVPVILALQRGKDKTLVLTVEGFE